MKLFFSLLFTFISLSLFGQCSTPNDPGFDSQATPIGYTTFYDMHNIFCAWDITHGDPNITVGIYDRFSNDPHLDLEDKIVDFDYSGSTSPVQHHGLSVAGLIAAIPDNNIACAGVGYNTTVATYNDTSPDNFDEAIAAGCEIINLSLTINPAPHIVESFTNNNGVLVTAGCDNHHVDIADIPGVINVGRCKGDGNGGYTHFDYFQSSISDKKIDIYCTDDKLNRLEEFNSYGLTNQGTSSMAPVVSGTAALMRSVNNSLTPSEVECIIKQSATIPVSNAPSDAYARILDVEAAVIFAQNWPNIPLGSTITLSGNQSISDKINAPGHIIIPTGSDISITGDITMMHTEGRIFVERGAKLTISGSTVDVGNCNSEWRGFIIEGNSSKLQPFPYGNVAPDDAGVLFLFGAHINNARNAISMHNKHKNTPLLYTGGVVIASAGTTFLDNGRSFEFMRYTLGETSQIVNCNFINNSRDVITAWRDDGLTIYGNTFSNYEDSGIFNATSIFSAERNIFNGKNDEFIS